MPLHIHHGPHLQALTDSLGSILASPPDDPFALEVVSVPTAGVRDWLLQQLSLRLGVVANIEFAFPGRFNAAILGEPLQSSSPWDLDRLTWVVLDVLERGLVDVPGADLRDPYPIARHIADLFDRYATNRPQMLQQWASGLDGDGTIDDLERIATLPAEHAWQPRLWRAVRELIGTPSRAELLDVALAALRSGAAEPALPQRVAMFGTSAVTTAQLQLLDALAAVRDVDLFVVHPSNVSWVASSRRLAGRLQPRGTFDVASGARHPLLRSWARPAFETAVLIGGLDASVESGEHPAVAQPTSVLHHLQAAIVTDAVPARAATTDEHAADRSVQIHACHGITRQLEVLCDSLGHAFVDDHTLRPQDVVILCPQLDRVAPLIESVFRRSTLPLPVRVSDLSLGQGNPIAQALSAVLMTASGRCTGPDLLALCSLAPVRRAFGLDDDDIERIDGWIDDLRITWGLGAGQRGVWVPDHIIDGTWTAALDRLLLGAAMAAPTPRVAAADLVPYDDMDASATATAGRLSELVARLERARLFVSTRHPIEDWVVLLTQLVESFCDVSPADAWQVTEVLQLLDEVADHAVVAGQSNPAPLGIADVRAVLAGVLADERGRLQLRSGAITATAMVPVRNVPYRVVCIVGLDEGTLRSAGIDGDDIVASRPCVGERDERVEGRHLLLDAVLAAGDRLIITCDGNDITTNRELPLPVLVSELVDVVRVTAGHDVVVRHPRQAFDERNFMAGSGGAGPGFDASMLAAATVRRTAAPASGLWPLLDQQIPVAVTIDQLVESCVRPARTYVRQRLDLRLPRRVEDGSTDIPLMAEALDQWKLAMDLIAMARVNATEIDEATWRDALRRSGQLPPGQLAAAAIDDIDDIVDQLFGTVIDLRDRLAAAVTVPVESVVEVPSAPGATMVLLDRVPDVFERQVLLVSHSHLNARSRMRVALSLAALVVAQPQEAWSGLIVMRPRKTGKPVARLLQPRSDGDPVAAARRFLSVAADLHVRALLEPLPLLEKTGEDLHETGNVEDDDFGRDLNDDASRFVWGDFTVDDLLAVPLREDGELPGVVDAARRGVASGLPGRGGRAVAFADHVWGAYEAFVDETDGAG